MSTRTVTVFGAVAIPTGHRVEVYVLTRDLGILSRDIRPDPDEPLVRDLDTGVYYGRHWQFAEVEASPTRRALSARRPEPPPGVAVAERFTGRVTTCVVWSDGMTQHQHTVTTLTVELEGSTVTAS